MLRDALVITRREVRDSLRDWRIVAPILVLALIFPWIMDQSTRLAIRFVETYSATIIPLRLVPFAMMIVGFFPISFSLIIALETFVGEKERSSLEPLLTTPISDAALYLGKLLSSMILPLLASYLGVITYLVNLNFSIHYAPDWPVLAQILLLTTMEALVMVAGAVVVSSHTTSVRAANLLASFIIVPMAFLLQAESILLFWGLYGVLWFIVAALIVVDLVLIRTGMRTFNREEILSGEIDELNWRATGRLFRQFFFGRTRLTLARIYREDVPALLAENRLPIAVTVLVLVGGVLSGWALSLEHPLPAGVIGPLHVTPETFRGAVNVPGLDLPQIDTLSIFWHNVQSLGLATLLGLFSFGSLALLLLLAPMGIVGFLAGQAGRLGTDPVTFLTAFVVPHGLLELPAAVLATAFALRLGASVISPPAGVSVGENLLHALADLVKIFVFVVVPLLLAAAWIEATITPQIVLWFYGR